MTRHLVLGLGVTGQAVVRALLGHGEEVVVVEDRPTDASRRAALELGVEVVDAPGGDDLAALVRGVDAVVP
ncbi:MAG: NAD(P)-binding domain-containing protein, partial [Actinomycetota bacterium]